MTGWPLIIALSAGATVAAAAAGDPAATAWRGKALQARIDLHGDMRGEWETLTVGTSAGKSFAALPHGNVKVGG